jgi:hypothetical protein
LHLNDEQLARLKPVVEELKTTLFNADYYLPMTIRPLPEVGREEYIKTNLKWHSPDVIVKNPSNPLT